MKLWYKLEEFLSKLLTNIIQFFTQHPRVKLCKVKIGKKRITLKEKFYPKFILIRDKFFTLKKKFIEIILAQKQFITLKISSLKEIKSKLTSKEAIQDNLKEFKDFIRNDSQNKIKQLKNFSFLKEQIKKKAKIIVPVLLIIIALVIFIPRYFVQDDKGKNKRKGLLSNDNIDVRPEYHKKYDHHITIDYIQIPVYLGKKQDLSSLNVDVVIETSNKYTLLYIKSYAHEVRDYLYTNLSPTIPEFPLGPEGQSILKLKIMQEINNFLKKKNVEGEILKVYVMGVIAS